MRWLPVILLLSTSAFAETDGKVWFDDFMRESKRQAEHREVMEALHERPAVATEPRVVYVPVPQPVAETTPRDVCRKLFPSSGPGVTLDQLNCAVTLDAAESPVPRP